MTSQPRLDDINYMDRLMAAFSSWAYQNYRSLGFPAAGVIWGVKTPRDDRHVHMLSATDEQFDRIDKCLAKLPWPKRKMIFCEYWMDEADEQKGKRFGLLRDSYRRRVNDLLLELYDSLRPEIEDWQYAIL